MGGEMKQFYLVMGEFDFVGICDAPDDAVMARYVLQLGSLGFVRTKTLKAFPGVTEGRRRPPRAPSRFRLNTGQAAGLECSTCVSTPMWLSRASG